MTKACYVGVAGKARKVKKIYTGVANKARKVKKAYVGVAGKARPFYSAEKGIFPYGYIGDLSVDRQNLTGISQISPKNSRIAFFAGGNRSNGTYHEYSNAVDIYDNYLTHHTGDSLSKARERIAAVAVTNRVLFAGGGTLSTSDIINNIDVYTYNSIHSTPNTLSQGREAIASGQVNGGQYAIFAGGVYGANKFTPIVDAYTETIVRTNIAALPKAIGWAGSLELSSSFYIVGGRASANTSSKLNTIYGYSYNLVQYTGGTLHTAKWSSLCLGEVTQGYILWGQSGASTIDKSIEIINTSGVITKTTTVSGVSSANAVGTDLSSFLFAFENYIESLVISPNGVLTRMETTLTSLAGVNYWQRSACASVNQEYSLIAGGYTPNSLTKKCYVLKQEI